MVAQTVCLVLCVPEASFIMKSWSESPGHYYEDGNPHGLKLQFANRQAIETIGLMDGNLSRDGMYLMLIKEPLFICSFHSTSFD